MAYLLQMEWCAPVANDPRRDSSIHQLKRRKSIRSNGNIFNYWKCYLFPKHDHQEREKIMSEMITIAAIETSPPEGTRTYPVYKIKSGAAETCYSNVGKWNAHWKAGMEVEVEKEYKKSKSGNVYFQLRPPQQAASSQDSGDMLKQFKFLLNLLKEEIFTRLTVIETKIEDLKRASKPQDVEDDDIPF